LLSIDSNRNRNSELQRLYRKDAKAQNCTAAKLRAWPRASERTHAVVVL
jgi:hypothetical protein